MFLYLFKVFYEQFHRKRLTLHILEYYIINDITDMIYDEDPINTGSTNSVILA